MKKISTLTAALLLTTSAASAAGIDRTLTNYGTLFEVGNYVELSYAAVRPSVSGTYSGAAPFGTGSTAVMSKDFNTLSGAVKYDLSDRIALGLFVNKPFGADAAYTQGFYTGLAAEWNATGTSIVMKYKATPNISVYGGVRSIQSQADIAIPDSLVRVRFLGAAAQLSAAATDAGTAGNATLAAELAGQATAANTVATTAPPGSLGYTASTSSDRQTSYIVGAAYERPEIALRVALTYESGYGHDFQSSEAIPALGTLDSSFTVNMPDVYTLDFQSGVATDTLVFGSIRHATWSDWDVRPDLYATLPGNPSVVGIENDSTTYRLGVGRKFNDSFSGFARITHEPSNGDEVNRLSPTDGSTAFGIGGSYTTGPIKVTGGVEYIKFGDGTDSTGTLFADNSAVAVGVTVGYRF